MFFLPNSKAFVFCLLISLLTTFFFPLSNAHAKEVLPAKEAASFTEVWGYVMEGNENELKKGFPITDVGYFSATINMYGELSSVPKRKKIPSWYKGRVHLVTSCDGRTLSHFVMSTDFPLREKLIEDLIRAAKDYDGLQIDYEYIPARDRINFLTFLEEVRKRLPKNKIFSIAVPARMRTISDDIYPYPKIEKLVDRVIIMAYDEHWSTSAPGSIASMPWSKKVGEYSISVIPSEKLVMGLPFYGRTWGDFTTNKAYYFSGINRLMSENNIHEVQREDGVPYFSFKKEIEITGYFEDEKSLVERTKLYKDLGIKNLAFWRVGQEDREYWNWLKTE